MENLHANTSILIEARNTKALIESLSVCIRLNESKEMYWLDMSKSLVEGKIQSLYDELKPIFDKYFGEGNLEVNCLPYGFFLTCKEYQDIELCAEKEEITF